MAPLNINRMWETANLFAQKNNVSEMRKLIRRGFPITVKDPKYSLLVTSSKLGHIEMTKLFLKNGVDVNERCLRGNSALDWSIYNNDVPMFELLLKEKTLDLTHADPDLGMTALMFAAKLGNVRLVQILLKRRLNPLSKDRFGRNAFFHCKQAEREEAKRIEKAKQDFMTDCVFTHPGPVGLKAHLREIEMPLEYQKILKLMHIHFLKERSKQIGVKKLSS